MNVESLCILVPNSQVQLTIYPIGEAQCYMLPANEAAAYHESRFQIVEGQDYEFTLQPESARVQEVRPVITTFRSRPNCGLLRATNLPGELGIDITFEANGIARTETVTLEVRSTKLDYRTHYRLMMESIAEKSVDLLLRSNSVVRQYFSVQPETPSTTLYQRFCFLKSALLAPDFQQAVHHVLANPKVGWTHDLDEMLMLRHRRVQGAAMRQLASGVNRVALPQGHALRQRGLHSLPHRITALHKKETVDTAENRFVKFALNHFLAEISSVREIFESRTPSPHAELRELREARACEMWLEETLQHPLFSDISAADSLVLNSPTLQRKHGYREIYRTWALFDVAARLSWQGGEDVYGAGKRDVATLYEYWAFFQMLEIFEESFEVPTPEISRLVRTTKDGLGLRLAAGKSFHLRGQKGKLQACFSYNRTFRASTAPKAGSYSLPMRPDFTISLWPTNRAINQAEKEEAIVHLHFDAKYRLETPLEFGGAMEDIKADERRGIYKRADILKMHAYKDAVRRTASAYVLYPGEKKDMRGLEAAILPAIGAFKLHPGDPSGKREIRDFIRNVAAMLAHNTGKNQAMTQYTHAIYSGKLHVTRDASWFRDP